MWVIKMGSSERRVEANIINHEKRGIIDWNGRVIERTQYLVG